LEDFTMKRITQIAGMASILAATAVMWSVPAAALSCGSSACAQVHDRWPGRPTTSVIHTSAVTPATGVAEPGILPLLAIGLGGVGFLALRRKRANAKI
jgi:hypothetical protein